MLLGPKIVYLCDHSVASFNSEVINESHIKQSFDSDVIITDEGVIKSVYAVYSQDPIDADLFIDYYEGIDFQINTDNISIIWISSNKPSAGDTFFIEYEKSLLTITQYDAEDCSRCAGMGWYVGLFEDNGTLTKKISGISKLVQDFIKILLTEKSYDYGSKLCDIPGAEINNEDTLSAQVISIVLDCEARFKQLQLTDINAGTMLDDSEKLNSASVTSVEFDRDAGAIFLSVVLLSESGANAQINLML
jgi:hypothetical protein